MTGHLINPKCPRLIIMSRKELGGFAAAHSRLWLLPPLVRIRNDQESADLELLDPTIFKAFCTMYFHDIVPDSPIFPNSSMMTSVHAEAMAEFIIRNIEEPDMIISCDGGVSRSSGTALAIAEAFKDMKQYDRIMNSPLYAPNVHVRNLLREALRKRIWFNEEEDAKDQ